MRLLFVTHGFPPEQPGVWTYHHAHQLAARHEICVFALATDPTRRHFEQWQLLDGNILVWRLNNLRVDHLRGFSDHQIDDMFEYALEYFSPDVVHFEHLIGLSATMPTRTYKRGIPSVLALYDYYWVCPRVNLVRGDYSLCNGPSHSFDCVTCLEGPGIAPPPIRQRIDSPGPQLGDPAAPSRVAAHQDVPREGIPPTAGAADDLSRVVTEPWRILLHDYRLNALRALSEYPDVITACSDSLRADLTSMGELPPGRIRTVSLGIPPLPGTVERQASDRVHIRYLGVTAPHKGVHVFAQAAKLLADLPVEFHLHGPAISQYLAEVLGEYPALTYHDTYDRDELVQILRATDVLVLPTLARETFSLVLREATLARVPVVASAIGAIPEFIRDGENGLLFPPGSVVDLAAALRRIVVDPDLRARLVGPVTAVRSLAAYSTEMEDIYSSLIAKSQERNS